VPTRVRKRDGREVPFDPRKIEAAVAKALRAVGEDDESFAGEIAGVVTLTLETRYGAPAPGEAEALPDIEEIQDLVEKALIELGRANVAKAYILYRDRRARAREALEVREAAPAGSPASRARVEVQTPERTQPWSKGRIVAALINEAQLTREVAERVASRVEERVFAAGLKHISTALVRELVDNELVALGLASALARQVSFGLPSFDLRNLLQSAPEPLDASRAAQGESLAERGVDARIAGEVLRRFALHEVLSEDAARAHLEGDLHVIELGRPHQSLTCAVPSQLVLAGAPSANSAFDALDELSAFARDVAHGVVLEDVATLLQPLAGGSRNASAGLGAWLRALAAVASGTGRNLDLCAHGSGARAQNVTERLVEELAALAPTPFLPRLFVDHADLLRLLEDRGGDAEFARAVEELLVAGRLIVTWGDGAERCVGPGLHRFAHEKSALSCGAAVAIDLPRIALRAGPWREDRAFELLSGACARAVEALSQLAQFQLRTRGARPGDVRGRVAYAVSPVGLREALAILGDGEIRPDQGARMLGYLAEALARHGEARKMSIVLTPFFGERARSRFAALDSELPQHAQRLLFGERERGESGAPYSVGYRLSPVPGRPIWSPEAELLATVGVGALHPLPEDRSRGGVVSLVDAWKRFDRLRVEIDSGRATDERAEGVEPARDTAPLFEPVPETRPPARRTR